jgi:CHAT domain-containing protein
MNNSEKELQEFSFLAMAFDGEQSNKSGLNQLAGANLELQSLSDQFGPKKILRFEDATEGNFKRLAPKFDIIHLAVHGHGDPGKKNNSSLYFRPSADSVEDNELHDYELYGMKLNAQLVVLSACESGLGLAYRGEGMMSMASAFACSGSRNILMSLWKVSDQTSVRIMEKFYQNLQRGFAIDEALTASKVSYLETADELSADPRIWAPMVAYGSFDFVIKKNRSGYYILIAVLLLAIPLLILISKRKKKYFNI